MLLSICIVSRVIEVASLIHDVGLLHGKPVIVIIAIIPLTHIVQSTTNLGNLSHPSRITQLASFQNTKTPFQPPKCILNYPPGADMAVVVGMLQSVLLRISTYIFHHIRCKRESRVPNQKRPYLNNAAKGALDCLSMRHGKNKQTL